MAAVMFVALCLATVSSADGHQIESQPPPEIQAQLTPILAAADRFFEGQQYAQAQAALERANRHAQIQTTILTQMTQKQFLQIPLRHLA